MVYALDLGKVFPVSPDEMPSALFAIEVAGIVASVFLTYLSLKAAHILMSDGSSTVLVAVVKWI
jgi:hypothetical protein